MQVSFAPNVLAFRSLGACKLGLVFIVQIDRGRKRERERERERERKRERERGREGEEGEGEGERQRERREGWREGEEHDETFWILAVRAPAQTFMLH